MTEGYFVAAVLLFFYSRGKAMLTGCKVSGFKEMECLWFAAKQEETNEQK